MRHIERWFSFKGYDVFVRDGYVIYASPSCFDLPCGSIKLQPFVQTSYGWKNVYGKVSWLDLKLGFPRGRYMFG